MPLEPMPIVRHLALDLLGDLHNGQEQSQLHDRLGEILIDQGLRNVNIATEIVAALDLGLVVGRGQDDDGRAAEGLVGLDAF